MSLSKRALLGLAAVALFGSPALAEKFPSKPIEMVCTTKPGSGAATWCQMLAGELSKKEHLGVPVNVVFKSGGSNHEPTVYAAGKPADGYTLMHVSGSFYGYFNLPHFTKTFDDFKLITQFERHLYGVAVRCDNPEGIKSWKDLVDYAKKNPNKLVMGSNKVGSIHHRHHVALYKAAGVDVRFVPYQGTGGVVKDVVGNHLKVGFAQPAKWNPHIEAGTICPLALLNEERLANDKIWKDVPTIKELGVEYDIPHQWQGFVVKEGTPDDRADVLIDAMKKVVDSDAYAEYLKNNPHVVKGLKTDRDAINKDFEKNLGITREFMIDNKIIEG